MSLTIMSRAARAFAVWLTLSAPAAIAAEPHRLSPTDIEGIRAKGEIPTGRLFTEFTARAALMRVFAQLSGGLIGKTEGFEQPVFISMLSYFWLSEIPVATSGAGRFIIGMACHSQYLSCINRSWFAIDTRTGDVAAILAHDYDDAGESLDTGRYMVFAMRCADPAVRDMAMKIARDAAETIAHSARKPASEAAGPRLIQAACR